MSEGHSADNALRLVMRERTSPYESCIQLSKCPSPTRTPKWSSIPCTTSARPTPSPELSHTTMQKGSFGMKNSFGHGRASLRSSESHRAASATGSGRPFQSARQLADRLRSCACKPRVIRRCGPMSGVHIRNFCSPVMFRGSMGQNRGAIVPPGCGSSVSTVTFFRDGRIQLLVRKGN